MGSLTPGRVCAALVPVLGLLACGGNPAGPSGGGFGGTVIFDGQTFEFTDARNAAGAFRRPSNPAWPRGLMDLSLIRCSGPPGLAMSIYDGTPDVGRYDVGAVPNEGVQAAWTAPSGEVWEAGWFRNGSGGSITVSSVSNARISGSFSFVMALRTTGVVSGIAPPPQTKVVEGTFELEIADRVVCG